MNPSPYFSQTDHTYHHHAAAYRQMIREMRDKLRTVRRMLVPIFLHRRRDILVRELHTLQRYPLPAPHHALRRLYLDVSETLQPTPRDWERWQEEFVPLMEHLYAAVAQKLATLEMSAPETALTPVRHSA